MRPIHFAITLATVGAVAACGGASVVPTPQSAQSSQISHLLNLHFDGHGRPVAQPHVMFAKGKRGALRPHVSNMVYGGGPIQSTPSIYIVYWGFSSDPNGEAARVTAFANSIGASSWANTLVQYSQTNPTARVSNPSGELKGVWNDNTNAVPASPTDAQVQAEAENLAAHFGVQSSNVDYVVALPHGHDPSGFGSTYCAYHSAVLLNWTGSLQTSTFLSYTNLPYMTDVANCGEDFVNAGATGTLDGVSIVLGHELAESQSDPWPDTGWADASGNEIGDKCAWINLQNTNFGGTTLGTNEFPTQPLWSNAISACTQGSSIATPSPGPSTTPTTAPSATPNGSYAAEVLSFHPLAFYELGETSGTLVHDASGHNYNGTSSVALSGLTSPGLYSGVTGFTWKTSTAQPIALPVLPYYGNATVSFLVEASNLQKTALPVKYWNNGFGYYLGHPAMTNFGPTGVCCRVYYDATHTLSAGVPHLLTFVSSATNRRAFVSVDGGALTPIGATFCRCNAVDAIDAATNAGIANTNCPSAVGETPESCTLDDIAIFPVALTAAQISQMYVDSGLTKAPVIHPHRGW